MPFEATAAEEQDWNAAALADPRSAPAARIWIWPQPAIVLGRSQQNRLSAVRAAAGPGVEVLVRGSGGGAVLAGPWMVGASVVLPLGHALLGRTLVDGYEWLGRVYRRVLAEFGVTAELLAPQRVAVMNDQVGGGPVAWACFGSLSPWELVDAHGRKLVGLAQQRRREAVLLVSAALTSTPPWALLCGAMRAVHDEARLAARTTSVEALAARPLDDGTRSRIVAALEQGIEAALDSAQPPP